MKNRFCLSAGRSSAIVFVITVLIHIGYYGYSARNILLSGDEPHYLMTVVSVLADGDIDLANNFRNRDYLRLGVPRLTPRKITGDVIHVYPTDPWGYSLILLPCWYLFGIHGVRFFSIFLTGW